MLVFKNEQHLPCSIPEISYPLERQDLSDLDEVVYLRGDLMVYPMNAGYLLSGCFGEFFVNSIDLLERINISGSVARDVLGSEKDREELEQYLHYGLISREKDAAGKLSFPEIDKKYFALYKDSSTTWFSYVPLKIELDITNLCNVNCKHCSRSASANSSAGKMSLQDYVDVIQQAGKIGVQEISFMGGEPTCNPAFIELAALAKMSGIKALFTSTNGWLIKDDLARRIAVLFDSVQVSIHGANAKTHDAIVGRVGAFERACNAVKMLTKHGVVSLNISCTVMAENVDEMDAMVQLARELGATSIRFLTLFEKGRGTELKQWHSDDKRKIAEKIRALRGAKRKSFRIEGGGVPAYSPISNDAIIYGCAAGRSLMYINADGDVTACGNVDHVIGNVRDARIMDLWHSPSMKALRNRPSCNCPYTEFCSGGCLANEKWASMFGVDCHPIM